MSELHEAAKRGDIAAVRELLEDDFIEVNEPDDENTTALYQACLGGHKEIAELLIDVGADLRGDIWDTGWGKSPLYAATKEGHTDLVALLLQRGADPNELTMEHRVPLYYAANGAIVRLLLDAGSNCEEGECATVVHTAAWDGRVDALKELVKDPKVDIHQEQEVFGTALCVAVRSDHVECVQVLVDAGACPYSECFDAWFWCDPHMPDFVRFVMLLARASGGDDKWFFEPIPGLEAALLEVWKKKPEALLEFFTSLDPTVQSKIQAALRALKRGKVTEVDLRKKILGEAFSPELMRQFADRHFQAVKASKPLHPCCPCKQPVCQSTGVLHARLSRQKHSTVPP